MNEAKTRVCRVPGETFDFLGYTIGRCYSPRTGRSYIGTRPSAKKVASLRDAIRRRREWGFHGAGSVGTIRRAILLSGPAGRPPLTGRPTSFTTVVSAR